MPTEEQCNDHLVLIGGKSATGKSLSLMFFDEPAGVIYLNCENNKKLPFKSKFMEKNVTDPLQIYEAFNVAETMDNIHTIIIDTSTYMMDMYETMHVLTSTNTMKAWGKYAQFWKKLMAQYVSISSKNVIFLAHTTDSLNETERVMETFVPVKGALKTHGIESYFSTVLSTKKISLDKLANYTNSMLVITEEDKLLGYKYVYQTRLTKETVNERMRSSLAMWSIQETYIDNNIQHVITRLREYYS